MIASTRVLAVVLAFAGAAALAQDGQGSQESADPRTEVGTLPGSAGSVNGEFEGQDRADPTAGLSEAAAQYAKELGLSVEEATARLIRQEELSDMLATLEEEFPDQIAGAWIEHQPDLRAVIRLTEGAREDQALSRSLDASGMRVEIAEGTGPSAEELARRLDRAMPEFQALGSGFQGAEIDVRTGEVVLLYGPAEDGGALSAATVERAESLASELMDAPVRIETYGAPASDGHTRGGADISTCTSGFVVRHPLTGTRGYITAGHCGNNQTYFEFGGVSYSTTFIGEIRDSNQDVQWHTTPHIELPEFYASSTSSARPLQGRRTRSQQSVGGYVCHRGKTTGYSCGYIQTKTYAPGYANACPGTTCASVWIRVSGSSLKCFPGDSGGPWFIAYRAYGIYKGQSSSGTSASNCNWAFYMASNYFGIDLVYD